MFSRAHPSKFCFDVICFTIDDGNPRAWVASVNNCLWRALPRIVSHLLSGPKQDWMKVYQYIDLQHWRPHATALLLTMEIIGEAASQAGKNRPECETDFKLGLLMHARLRKLDCVWRSGKWPFRSCKEEMIVYCVLLPGYYC